jgi:uncharacterized protein YaiE (UPF0345 family)
MESSIKRARVLVVAVVSACALFAFSVGTAAATPVSAYWVNPGAAKVAGSINIKLNGANEKTCTAGSNFGSASNTEFGGGSKGGTLFLQTNSFYPYIVDFSCTGGTKFQLQVVAYTEYDSGYLLKLEKSGSENVWQTPYGTWIQWATSNPWTNAAGGKASFFTFNNTAIGRAASGGTITATGSLNVTRSTGAELTLTH